MFKKIISLTFIIAVALALAYATDVSMGESIEEATIRIVSPSGKQVERNTTVELRITVVFAMSDRVRAAPKGVEISYKLDNDSITPLNDLEMFQWSNGWWEVQGKTLLVDLAEGSHKLTAYSTSSAGLKANTTTNFTVDTSYEYPKLSVLSPQNKNYTTSEVPLVFYVNGNISDGYVDLSISPYLSSYPIPNKPFPINNMTLSELKDGDYKLYIGATTERGRIDQIIEFSVNTNFLYKNQQILITIGIIAIVLTILALIKYKRDKTEKLVSKQSFL
ncbi:hypothetical protein GX563_07530 [Candidatus Bathyarchaeota archaeon]|nr:hypothetical protein [Candidatus Bathyarchaeota archaeon]